VGPAGKTPLFFNVRRTAAPGIEQPYARTHHLLKILVARHHDDIHGGSSALRGDVLVERLIDTAQRDGVSPLNGVPGS
jgi:hypothetical protein